MSQPNKRASASRCGFAVMFAVVSVACGGNESDIPADAPSIDAPVDAVETDSASIDSSTADAPAIDSAQIDSADAGVVDALPADAPTDASIADASAQDAPTDAPISVDAQTDASVDASLPPTITGVQLVGAANSTQIRQGAGTIRLQASGAHLLPVTAISLGGLPVQVLSGSQENQLIVDVEVAHGVSVGARDLSVTTPAGSDTLPSAIVVTEISAAPVGNDTTGRGTPDSPFKTATRAVVMSGSGDTVQLANGVYNSLETWPLTNGMGFLSDITLRGESDTNTILMGPGSGTPNSFFAQRTVVQSLRITGFQTCAIAWSASTLRSLRVDGCETGVRLSGNAQLRDSTVSATRTAVSLNGAPANEVLAVRNVTASQEGSSNSFDALYVFLSTGDQTRVIVEDSTFVANTNAGQTAVGIQGQGSGSVSIRRSNLTGYRALLAVFGLEGPATIDLGTSADLGSNHFQGTYCVEDMRSARAAPDGPIIQLVGSWFNGVYQGTPGIVTGPVDMPPSYRIWYANNRIAF